MATTTQHIAARNDSDLLTRFVAAAEMKGIPNAYEWVQQRMPELISQEVEAGQTITDVFAYAFETRKTYIEATPPPPGLNPGAVLDTHLNTAIDEVYVEAP